MPTHAVIEKERDLIIGQIKKYVGPIRPFLELDVPLQEYSRRLYDFNAALIHRERQRTIATLIIEKCRALLGPDAEQRYRIALPDQLACNIVDHHQILNHPLLIPSNIVGNVAKITADAPQDAIVVIACGDTPPNNYFNKSGFQLHGKRIPLFSVSEREHCSYYIPVREIDFVERLKSISRWDTFDAQEQEFLIRHQAALRSIDYSRCSSYLDQVTCMVRHLWPLMFENALRDHLPNLLYISQEELVTKWLIESIGGDSLVTAVLFDPSMRARVIDNFRGIAVTWDERAGKGTHFFWRKHPDEPRALRMYLDGDTLVPVDSRMTHLAVPLTREAITDLLERREIYPSLFTIFSVLHFYAGIKPLAGYGSVVYLDLFKEAWEKTLVNSDFKDEIPLIESVQTDGFIGGIPLFFKRQGARLTTQYAADVMFDGGVSREYLDKVFALPFNNLFSIGVADVYEYYSTHYVPEAERITPTIDFDDLAELALPWL